MKQARPSTNWRSTTTTPLFAHKACRAASGYAGALTFATASPAKAVPLRLPGLLNVLDNLDITNDPLLAHQAFLNATLSETNYWHVFDKPAEYATPIHSAHRGCQ